jgi:hypothetical protein
MDTAYIKPPVEQTEIIKLGDYQFDAFIGESGSLGFTVTEPGKKADDFEAKSADIFVSFDKTTKKFSVVWA